MSPITRSASIDASEAIYVGPIFETRNDVEVRIEEGSFAEPCEICFGRPTAVYVEVRRPDTEAAQKTGAFAVLEPVERRFFCATHICAADLVYRSY